jgi:hypothetical protein
MHTNEIENHLNVTSKFELVNGAIKYGILNKQLDSDLYKSDYYFISLQNLKNFQRALTLRNYEICKTIMEKINIKFIKSIEPI